MEHIESSELELFFFWLFFIACYFGGGGVVWLFMAVRRRPRSRETSEMPLYEAESACLAWGGHKFDTMSRNATRRSSCARSPSDSHKLEYGPHSRSGLLAFLLLLYPLSSPHFEL